MRKIVGVFRCNFPLEVCLENPQYITDVACSGEIYNAVSVLTVGSPGAGNQYSLQTCLQNPPLLTKPACLAGITLILKPPKNYILTTSLRMICIFPSLAIQLLLCYSGDLCPTEQS